MRILLLMFLLCCACSKAYSQIDFFNRSYDFNFYTNGYTEAKIINHDTSIVFGWLYGVNHRQFITYTFIDNATGDTLRTFKHGRDTIDIYGGSTGYNCIIDNIIYSVGAYYKNGNAYANFLKFSKDGNLMLDSLYYIPVSTQYAWTQFNSMLPLNDGNFLVVGNKETSYGNLDAWLVKMDPNGNILWEKTFNYSTYDRTLNIVPHQGNFLISAGKKVSGEFDIWLLCVDSDGNLIWQKTYGGPYYDGGIVLSLNNGEIHVCGQKEYADHYYESFVMRLNYNGDLLWQKSLFRNHTYNKRSSLDLNLELSDGSILNVGVIYENESPMANPVGIIYKMSMDGDSIWTRKLKLRNNDHYPGNIEYFENGDLLISGYVFPDSPNNTGDGWIMRTNCLGYFEHPKDSIVLSSSGENVLSLTNYSSYYDYTIVDWGDNSSDTVYASGNQNIMHEYTLPGNYSINTTTIACNDTIHKSSEYLVIPEQYESSNLVIFPNPNQGQFEIWLDSPDLYSLEIMDLNGRIVKSALNVKMNQGYIIDLSELGSSIYLVRAAKEENIIQQRVVVIR